MAYRSVVRMVSDNELHLGIRQSASTTVDGRRLPERRDYTRRLSQNDACFWFNGSPVGGALCLKGGEDDDTVASAGR